MSAYNPLLLAASTTASAQDLAGLLFTHSRDPQVMVALAGNPALPFHLKVMLASREEPEIARIAIAGTGGIALRLH